MRTVETRAQARTQIRRWREAGERVTLVPTMGALHEAHLNLVRLAKRSGRAVVSIFVNPKQFAPDEDFERYPRDLEVDAAMLREGGADLLFAPATEEVYPGGLEGATRVEVPGLSADLCGAHRPAHFAGVVSVVARLLLAMLPDAAIFGRKDYQQLVILRRMVADLHIPVEVVEGPITREDDGLAMSSRNRYLSAGQRRAAPLLHAVLRECAQRLRAGERNFARLEQDAMARLQREGFAPDYVAVRRADDLGLPPSSEPCEWVILAAAWLGAARLIDNVTCSPPMERLRQHRPAEAGQSRMS